MIYTASEYLSRATTAPKALTLAQLQQKGYPVPPLLIVVDEDDWSKVAENITALLPAQRYAVRFAADDEDTVSTSNAGRYVTKLDVASKDLAPTLALVVEKSVARLNPKATYAVIVQEYIAAEFSGVAFTRHPQGQTNWLIEYAKGAAGVVGGEATTSLAGGAATDITKLPKALQKLCALLPKIEQEFAWPQDIEWCSVKDELFILQSRPITSIDTQMWSSILYLSQELANTHHYHYRSDSGVETYQYPKPLDYSLLQYLYSPSSAVAQAYAKLNIQYTPTNQFRQLGNRLYIDTEKEQQTIFPTYRLNKPNNYHLVWWPLSDVWRTAHNRALISQAIHKTTIESVCHDLCTLLAAPAPIAHTLDEALTILKQQYSIIFTCNYLVQRQEFKSIMSQSSTLITDLAQQYKQPPTDLIPGVTIGNSLALDDSSLFVLTTERDFNPDRLTDTIRELTRWQSIRLRKMMFDCIWQQCLAKVIPSPLVPFTTLPELIKDDIRTDSLEQRKNQYESQKNLLMPNIVSAWVNEELNDSLIISPGQASGILLKPNDLASTAQEVILLVDTLSPDCVQYFSRISGVVCRSGGLLSHAAIVAREQKIPVLKSSTINLDWLGQKVRIGDESLVLEQ
jgi:phosphohistidine swiveling domain-containing protein